MDSQINPQHYLSIEKGAASNAHSHANLQRHYHRLMHYYNGGDVAKDQGGDVNQHLVQLYLVPSGRISGEVVDDPTLKDRYCYAYYAALKAEMLKFNNKPVNLMKSKGYKGGERKTEIPE